MYKITFPEQPSSELNLKQIQLAFDDPGLYLPAFDGLSAFLIVISTEILSLS